MISRLGSAPRWNDGARCLARQNVMDHVMDFTIVFHLKNTIYIHAIINFSLLNLNDFCMIPKTWTNHDKSCCKPAIKCCSIAFHFHSHRQSESSADGEEALQSCHLQRLTPPPSETQESVETLPCRIQVFVPVFETFELYMSRSNFKIGEDMGRSV